MSLANRLNHGFSMAQSRTLCQKISCLLGRMSARRHKGVQLGHGCCVSPDAWIHPRNGTIRLGDRCSVAPGAMLQGNISFGNDCSVQAYSVLTGYSGGEIQIGNEVRIASHVTFVAANHRFEALSCPIAKQGLLPEPIRVGDDVWIGTHACILAGVTIGKGCVIGAGSVVTRDIPPYSVAAGVPARIIRKREHTVIQNPAAEAAGKQED